MPRPGITAAVLTELNADSTTSAYLMEFQFSTGTLLLTTAAFDLLVDGQTWIAVGGALGFDSITEANDLQDRGVTVVLSGVSQGVIQPLLEAAYQNRTAVISRVFFNASTGQPIAPAIEVFRGFMNGGFEIEDIAPSDSPELEKTTTITGLFQDLLMQLDTRGGIQTNTDSHQQFFPGDLFFQFTPALEGAEIIWGVEV